MTDDQNTTYTDRALNRYLENTAGAPTAVLNDSLYRTQVEIAGHTLIAVEKELTRQGLSDTTVQNAIDRVIHTLFDETAARNRVIAARQAAEALGASLWSMKVDLP